MILPPDKMLHLCAGYIMRDFKVPLYASFLIAFGKEVYDYMDYGRFDIYDFIVTILGIGIYELKRIDYGKNRRKKSAQALPQMESHEI